MASPLFLCILLIVCTYRYIVAGAGPHSFVVVTTSSSSFQPKDVCSTSTVTPRPDRTTAPLVHRHGPCAPSPSTIKKTFFAQALQRSRARADYIMSRASRRRTTQTQADGKVSVPAYIGDSVDSLEYIVTLGLGTPAVEQVVLMDTGSDLSWVQCKPCNSSDCYPQKDPLFDPSKSSTYAPLPCGSRVCKTLEDDHFDNGCTNGTQCGFRVEYGDGFKTTGVYSNEALTLAPGVVINNFHFGCGYHQGGPNDKYDGLLGLGGAPESLPVQTSKLYGPAFSYCLPAVNSGAGFLALGAPSNTSGFLFTPMTRFMHESTFYLVTLTGISVGGKQLSIPPKVFEGGMIIDCGSILTRLPDTAYEKLKSAFRAAMAAYPLVPGNDDTCYNFTGYSNVTVPSVALTFSGGVTVDLDVPNGVLLDDCLAFSDSGPDDYVGMIGDVNQRTLEMLYDVGVVESDSRPVPADSSRLSSGLQLYYVLGYRCSVWSTGSFLGGFYQTGGYGEGFFIPTWVAA